MEWTMRFLTATASIAAVLLCGPASAEGVAEVTGQRNPDRSLRRRPSIGLPFLWGLTPAKGGWEDGRLYNPDTRRTFRSSLRLKSARQLHVTGCLGPLCRTEAWTCVSSPQQKGCDADVF